MSLIIAPVDAFNVYQKTCPTPVASGPSVGYDALRQLLTLEVQPFEHTERAK